MMSNRHNMNNVVQSTKNKGSNRKKYVSVARALISRLPHKESKQQQARDPQGISMPEPMDVTSRRETTSNTSQRPPFLVPRSPQKNDITNNSIEKLCYKLDLDLDSEDNNITTEEPLPPRRRRRSNSRDDSMMIGTNLNMAMQTAQIFRGVQISEDGTVISENHRASRSNAGKKARKGKRSRQAANIHRAWDQVDGTYSCNEGNNVGETNKSSKVLSLVVIGEYDAMDDLIRDAPRKLQKLESDLSNKGAEAEEEETKDTTMTVRVTPLTMPFLELPQLV